MTWATRPGCHVDRAACAWLIRRFIDADAEFVFVEDPDDIPADSHGFDIRGVELTHHNGDCSFETFLKRYELHEEALWSIARIVHEADLGDERYYAPEAMGLDVLIRGLSLVLDDASLLDLTTSLFDGLYQYCRRGSLVDDR